MSKVKLQDIAKEAGVSMMTVSRVMNNDPKVGAKTREKVSAIAKKMQYQPNLAARHLASSKSFFIGLVCEYANVSYVNKFLVGSMRRSRSTGYNVVLDECTSDKQKTLQVIKDLISITRVDGLILLPPITDNPEVIELIKQSNTPFVRIAPNTQLNASPYICMDDYQAAFDVTEQLINSGHKRIAHIMGTDSQGVSHNRCRGYNDALAKRQLSMPDNYVVPCDFSYKSGLQAATQLFSLDPAPDAIFAANDEMAAAAISVAHQHHIQVPEQVSIIGFDDTELATTVWPNISTVRQPLEQMAELAIDILSRPAPKACNNNKASVEDEMRHVLDYALLIRESSKDIV